MASEPNNDAPPVQSPASPSSQGPVATASTASAQATQQTTAAPASAQVQPSVGTVASAPNGNGAEGEAEGGEDDPDSDEEEDSEEWDSECESDFDSDGEPVDDVEKFVERKNRLYIVDEDGDIYWKHESSYTTAEYGRRGRHMATMMYDRASPSELRKFIKERGLPDPYSQGLTLKYFYLRRLEKSDQDSTFRFLDLPPEMRNMVYVELLTFEQTCPCHACSLKKSCHPAILRVNKQIYKEAKDVLYAENTISCRFVAATDEYSVIGRCTRVHSQEAGGSSTTINKVPSGISAIPEWFHRVQSLRIDIEAHGLGAIPSARGYLQGCTLNLASFLLDGHRLKKLHVHIINHLHAAAVEADHPVEGEGSESTDPEDAKMTSVILYPLRRLSGLVEVKITGNVDESLSSAVITDIQRPSEPTFNTLPHLSKLRREAKAFVDMVRLLNPDHPDSPPPPWEDNDRCDRVQWLLAETEYNYGPDQDTGEFADAAAEANLRRKMDNLKACLDATRLVEFQRKLKTFVKAREERVSFVSKHAWSDIDAGGGKRALRFAAMDLKWDSRLRKMYDDGYDVDEYMYW